MDTLAHQSNSLSDTGARMPTLMTTPYDLRAIILDIVLFSPSLPTNKTDDFHQAALHSKGLLLANRQLHAECLDRLSLHPLTYHLDITIENERDFLPIWKIVPVVAAHVSHVRTTITAKDDRSKLEDQDYRPSKFESENGGSPPIMWSFYNLLRSFTTHNTAALTSNIHHTIGFLDIDILTPSLKPNQRFHPKGRLRSDSWRQEDGLDPMVDYVMRPDYLLTFLASEMTYLLAMTYDRSIYGSFLYESVGSIRMGLDGNPISTWDLGDKLASFPQKGPIEAFQKGRQRDWKEYYDTAIESRRKHGLPVGKADT